MGPGRAIKSLGLAPAREAGHRGLGFVKINPDILAHRCTSWLRAVPSSAKVSTAGASAPWSIETAFYLSLDGAAVFM